MTISQFGKVTENVKMLFSMCFVLLWQVFLLI